MRRLTIPVFEPVLNGETLDEQQSGEAFAAIMEGHVPDDELADFLLAMAKRGPAVTEIVGAARVLRASMKTISAPEGAVDLCGTGGDGHATLNISTAASFVVAGCGLPVAKHGNRSATSRAGAADILEALGVKIDIDAQTAARCFEKAGLCFLFAQAHHPAMRHVAEARRRVGTRTIFNLLGPLCNPAGVRHQLLGVYAKQWLTPLAEVLLELGTESAWIVHGRDGLDEMTTTNISHVAILGAGQITLRDISAEEIGIPCTSIDNIKGGDARFNAEALLRLLKNDGTQAYLDIVLLNSAVVLVMAKKARDLLEGFAIALESVRSGRALAALNNLIAVTQAA